MAKNVGILNKKHIPLDYRICRSKQWSCRRRNTKSQIPHMSLSVVVLPCCNQVEVSWSHWHSSLLYFPLGSPVPSLASHAVHHYWQCSLLQHSITIVLYACRWQSSFTVHDKQALSVRRDDPNKKEWRRTGQISPIFFAFHRHTGDSRNPEPDGPRTTK
jgi:hypothetical protein